MHSRRRAVAHCLVLASCWVSLSAAAWCSERTVEKELLGEFSLPPKPVGTSRQAIAEWSSWVDMHLITDWTFSQVAYIEERADGTYMWNGRHSYGPYSGAGGPAWSTTAPRRFAFVAVRDGTERAVIDGSEQTPYADVQQLVFSPDGKRVAYEAYRVGDGQSVMVLDGTEVCRAETMGWPTFSSDGTSFAYRAMLDRGRGKAWYVVEDGLFSDPYYWVDFVVAFDNVGRCVYQAKDQTGEFLVVGGHRGKSYDAIVCWAVRNGLPTFVAHSGNRLCVVRDGVEGQWHDIGGVLEASRYTPSPSGEHWVVSGSVNGRSVCLLDGALLDSGRGDMAKFSPSEAHVGYRLSLGGRYCVVIDGVPGQWYDSVEFYALSNEGRLFIVSKDGDRERAVIDGAPQPPYVDIWGPVFGSDGVAVAYLAGLDEETCTVVCGDQEQRRCTAAVNPAPQFMGGKYLCYVSDADGAHTMVIDGQPGESFDMILQNPWRKRYALASDDELQYVAVQGRQVYRVRETVRQTVPTQ